MFDIFLIAGVFVLSLSLRSLNSTVARKLGTFGFLATSFLIGWRFTESLPMGFLFASFWLVWPWYELITRVRKITMPAEKTLRHKTPPHSEFFPALANLTSEIEDEVFEHLEDLGRDWDEVQQFFRIFHKADERTQAVICLIEQESYAFYYIRLISRAQDGTVWTTWNYPFSINLKVAPEWRMNRESSDKTFIQLLDSHRACLKRNGILTENLLETNPLELADQLQSEQRAQIAHNVTAGILAKGKDGAIRYTWRGLLFIWLQFLRDFVKLH